jgi:hypothetical protein
MGALTEREILDCLKTNTRLAIENCENLAVLPRRGPTYNAFRHQLKLIEGSCRQIAFWREDARWLQVGLAIEEAHKRAGHWLRRHYPRPLFVKLADNLRLLQTMSLGLETKATGKLGMILPKVADAPGRQRAVQAMLPAQQPRVSPGGILLP